MTKSLPPPKMLGQTAEDDSNEPPKMSSHCHTFVIMYEISSYSETTKDLLRMSISYCPAPVLNDHKSHREVLHLFRMFTIAYY